jgi:hypothetical protein
MLPESGIKIGNFAIAMSQFISLSAGRSPGKACAYFV